MKKLIRIEESIAGYMIIFISLMAFVQVLSRYIFQIPTPWIEETLRFVMVVMVFIVSANAITYNSHLKVEILKEIFSPQKQRYLDIFINILILFFLIYFVKNTIIVLQQQFEMPQTSPAIGLPMAWPFGGVMLGGILMLIHLSHKLYKIIFQREAYLEEKK